MVNTSREADDWWGTLPADRRDAIHRWVSKRPAIPQQPEEQMTIDDFLLQEETGAET